MTIAYKVHNVAHGRHNRSQRAALPANPHMKQFIGNTQMRVLPGRPVHLSQEQFEAFLPELRDKAAACILEVRTLDGRVMNLETLEAEVARVSPPLLKKRLDSVEHDKPSGIHIPPYVGEDGALPAVMPKGAKPALLQEETPPPPPEAPPIIPAPVEHVVDEAAIAAATGEVSTEELSETFNDRKSRKNRR